MTGEAEGCRVPDEQKRGGFCHQGDPKGRTRKIGEGKERSGYASQAAACFQGGIPNLQVSKGVTKGEGNEGLNRRLGLKS
eukprot:1141570-Pelagomonas_calceolata.AAC.3